MPIRIEAQKVPVRFLPGHNRCHPSLQACGRKGFTCDHRGNAAVQGAVAGFHGALVALTMAQRPFVFEEVQASWTPMNVRSKPHCSRIMIGLVQRTSLISILILLALSALLWNRLDRGDSICGPPGAHRARFSLRSSRCRIFISSNSTP